MLRPMHQPGSTRTWRVRRRYDFALPLLVLHAFEFQSATNLKHWLSVCPRRQITVLDTHDGMGIDDITGLANVRRIVCWQWQCSVVRLLQQCFSAH